MIAVCTEGNLSLISVNRRLVYIAHSAEEKGKAIRAIYRMMKGRQVAWRSHGGGLVI